jgi:hypothetical protein
MSRRPLLLAAIALVAVLGGATGAGATLPPVVLGCNGGNASIIQDAMGGAAPGTTIQLAGSCTYTITSPVSATSGLPPVVTTLTITGATGTVIDGNNGPTPFLVQKKGKLTLSGVTVQHGTGLDGGGIHVAPGGSLTLTNDVITGNTATEYGGGLYVAGKGKAALTSTSVDSNTSDADSGGIDVEGGGSLTMTGGTVSNNQSGGYAGGLGGFGKATENLSNVTLNANHSADNGGGAHLTGKSTLTNVTISNNMSVNGDYGGGIVNYGKLKATTVTITGNTISGQGGGIYNEPKGNVSFTGSTITGNTALSGGGIYNTGKLKLATTMVSGNSPNDCTGTGC